jgi:hypothetical protein
MSMPRSTFLVVATLFFTVLVCKSANLRRGPDGALLFHSEADLFEVVSGLERHLESVTEILLRTRVLALRAASGVHTAKDFENMQAEFAEIFSEIKRVRLRAIKNGVVLMNAGHADWVAQLAVEGDDAQAPFRHTLAAFDAETFHFKSWSLEDTEIRIDLSHNPSRAIGEIDNLIDLVVKERIRHRTMLMKLKISMQNASRNL